MKLEIVTPQKLLMSQENVQYVRAPGVEGDFGILDSHAPMVSALRTGAIVVTEASGKESTFEIEQGFLEVSNNTVTVLAEAVQ